MALTRWPNRHSPVKFEVGNNVGWCNGRASAHYVLLCLLMIPVPVAMFAENYPWIEKNYLGLERGTTYGEFHIHGHKS